MNDDKWQRTVAKRRRQRRIQNLFACFIVLLVLLILSIIGGYYYYQRTNSPEHALEELQTAFEHRDIDTIHKYVDLKTLLPPNYKILTNDIFINDKIYTEKEHSIYQTFYALIEPIIVNGAIQSIDKYIQTGNWQRFNYDSMLKGRQLGIDYTELINRSLLFNISFKEIKSIETIDDNSVMATILVADKYTDTNFDLKLKLVKNEEGIWQVSEVTNYQDYLTMISNLYRQDINTYLTNTKADLDRNNAQFKQLQSEFIVLAENFKNNPSSSQRALLKSFIDNKIVPTYQDWYNYLQSYQIPTGARHLHELRMESTTYTIQAWKAYAIGIQLIICLLYLCLQLINFIFRVSEAIFLKKLHIKKEYNNLYSFCFYLCQNYLDIASNNTLFSS